MQYSFVAAAVLAFTSSVFAQTAGFAAITVPTQDQNVAAGSVLDITWQPSTEHPGPITIQLLQGATPSTLEIGETVAQSIDQTTGKFAWTVPKDLKSFATYGFKLTLDSTKSDANPIFQFSFPFHVTRLSSTSSSSASATGGTTTVHVSTGPSYTAKPTSSSYSASSVSVNSTSTYVPSSSHSASASASMIIYPTANITLSTTLTPTTAPTGTGSSPSSTGSSPSTVTGNSASTLARGGLVAAAGMVLAFAL